MLFLNFSKSDMWFAERDLVWRTYTAAKTLSTTRKVEIINKREFAAEVPNADDEIFVVHVAALAKLTTMPINSSYQAQAAMLTSEKTGILTEYFDFSNIFSSDSAAELPEHTGINDHSIDLQDNKQPPYGLIYSLGPVELETLKTYIEANLASSYIRPSKSFVGTSILFVQKKNGSLCLCVDY